MPDPHPDSQTAPAAGSPLRVGVVIATLGRSDACGDVLRWLLAQTLPAAKIVFSVEKPQDLPDPIEPDIQVVMGPRGLCAQRNRGIAALRDACDVIAFFDDDYIPSIHALQGLAELFAAHPEIVGATGWVLADGVGKGGIDTAPAEAIVTAHDQAGPRPWKILGDTLSAYGCNMAFRTRAMEGLAFDERLPLYGWQEDVDFAGQIRRQGRLVKTDAFAGVHRGVTTSRTPGARLGFSQIVNPIYLARKKTMTWPHALRISIANIIANHVKMLRPEPHIDRAGRARGNWIAIGQILSGRIEPEGMLKID
jgi:GT2 family glycosyltransferase